MKEYIVTNSCRMKYLCDYLGDKTYECGICDNDTFTGFQVISETEDDMRALNAFKENTFPILEVETLHTKLKNGVAASYYGFSRVGEIIHKCKYGMVVISLKN